MKYSLSMAMPLRVLHIDTDPLTRDAVRTALEYDGDCRVWSCASSLEAQHVAARIKPDIILMDMQMQEQRGTRLPASLRSIRACRDTPMVFLTSSREPREIQSCYDNFAIGYIPKPVNMASLKEDILSLMKAERLVDAVFSRTPRG